MPPLDLHYTDPRLVALYDLDNPAGDDTRFYLGLAAETQVRQIIDLGCGTGLLTRALAQTGARVFGVDPAPAMLAWAQQQPGAEQVSWIQGDHTALPRVGADLALMTGNVAQIFLDDADWLSTLQGLHTALRPGGLLAFESRHPQARAWEGWTRGATYERLESPAGPLECWIEVQAVIEQSLRQAGFGVRSVYGDWHHGDLTPESRVMVFVAERL